jgi:excisionase family DNA binding protein
MSNYMTTVEVAEALRAPVETVRYWRHVGKGPKSFKLGRRVLYALEDVEAFIAEARNGGTAAGR